MTEDALTWRADAMRTHAAGVDAAQLEAMRKRGQEPEHPRPIPTMFARPDVPTQPGHCYSCGDPSTDIRCHPCREAAALIVAERT